MMRYIVHEKRREAKAAKKLSIIVLFFMICWMPLYTINCIQVRLLLLFDRNIIVAQRSAFIMFALLMRRRYHEHLTKILI